MSPGSVNADGAIESRVARRAVCQRHQCFLSKEKPVLPARGAQPKKEASGKRRKPDFSSIADPAALAKQWAEEVRAKTNEEDILREFESGLDDQS
jgi:hypothetical protein